MSYTKKQFVEELKQQLQYGYDVKKVANWAHWLSIDKHREIDSELYEIMQDLAVMGEGSEFELSEKEVLNLINKLEASE